MADDMDMMAMMGIAGFGKKVKKRELDPKRFEKNRREQVCWSAAARPLLDLTYVSLKFKPTAPVTDSDPSKTLIEASDERESSLDAKEPQKKSGPTLHDGEPEFNLSEDEDDLDDDTPEFPTTHELIMKDHTKVISALALDPSGARIVSGSHDYDCKLWDFGGMDHRCKPFKSWEPAGSYYVSIFFSSSKIIERGFYIRFCHKDHAEMRRVDT